MWGITPYVATELALQDHREPKIFRPNIGSDARIDPTSGWRVKLTVNPDFSDVEADQDRLLLDRRSRCSPSAVPSSWRASTSSSRPSRCSPRAASPAARMTRCGRRAVHRQGGRAGLLAAGRAAPRRPGRRHQRENLNSGVLRLQQDLGKRSAISLVASTARATRWFRTTGLDANIHICRGAVHPGAGVQDLEHGGPQGLEAYKLAIHRFDTHSEFWIQLEDIGKRYANPLGYTPVSTSRARTRTCT